MKSQPPQQQNKSSNDRSSTFVRTRNNNKDIPLSSSKIRKRIRDVNRTLIKGTNVSAQVITESKRRLRVLQYELGEKTVDEAEKNNAAKYHKVRHFERKKSERKVRQAQKSLNQNTDESKSASLQEKLDDCEIKLLYTSNYPKTLPYVSIYPKENENDRKSVCRKEGVLKDIKESLLAGDKDLILMNKRYREEYKQKLIKKGLIKQEAPVDEVESPSSSKVTVTVKKKKDNNNSSSDSDSDIKMDDFFENA